MKTTNPRTQKPLTHSFQTRTGIEWKFEIPAREVPWLRKTAAVFSLTCEEFIEGAAQTGQLLPNQPKNPRDWTLAPDSLAASVRGETLATIERIAAGLGLTPLEYIQEAVETRIQGDLDDMIFHPKTGESICYRIDITEFGKADVSRWNHRGAFVLDGAEASNSEGGRQ